MLFFTLYVAALSLLAAADNQTFTNSGEIDISTCPITYYGQKYETLYVNKFRVCFKGFNRLGMKNDCILMSKGTADRGGLSVLTREIPTGSGVHRLLPNLQTAGKCVNLIPLKDSQQSQVSVFSLMFEVVSGRSVSRQIFQTSETMNGIITDVSGCRHKGSVYKINTTVWDPNICSNVTCDAFGVATVVSDCGPMERCKGNGSCIMDAMCTVTGPTIIDVMGHIHTVPDRCGYTLMKHASIPGFQVLGVFQERRRRDVSFLDRVIIHLSNAKIFLEQGGRVKVDDQELLLRTNTQSVHGVMFSKDPTGVTAKITTSNHTVSVHFNGYTAQIHITGPSGTPVHGLCGSSFMSLSRLSFSMLVLNRCNVLDQAPFTACKMHVNPESFMSACNRTLHKYPAVDGLKCQFLEAYARACSQYNITVEGWRSKTRCSRVPKALCQDRYCSAHEFCGERRYGGERRCLCRAIFASKYRTTDSFGEPTVCEHKSATLTLAGCLLEENGIDYSVLHLNDQNCMGKMDNETHMVTFRFNPTHSCGTVVMANNSEIIYKNTIKTRNSSMFGVITRHDPVYIDFSCFYHQPDIKSMAIRLKHSSLTKEILYGQWMYNLTMNAFADPDHMQPIDSRTDIELDQKIWVVIMAEGLDEKQVALVTDSCWATDQPLPNGSLRYDLVIKGCPNPEDRTINVESNGMGTATYFSFNTFQFSGKTSDVYLHCRLELCIKQTNSCAPICQRANRRRRSAMPNYLSDHHQLITMAWTS
uniref:ZP domain-containing protein n=1 Tax=Sphaeramia orbicularis TaxID=375764 RepID=A0A673AZI9_9TELE